MHNNKELNFCSSANVIKVITSRRWTGHVARKEVMEMHPTCGRKTLMEETTWKT